MRVPCQRKRRYLNVHQLVINAVPMDNQRCIVALYGKRGFMKSPPFSSSLPLPGMLPPASPKTAEEKDSTALTVANSVADKISDISVCDVTSLITVYRSTSLHAGSIIFVFRI